MRVKQKDPKTGQEIEVEVEETETQEETQEEQETQEQEGTEEETDETEGLTVEELRARLRDKERKLRAANTEAKERRLKLKEYEQEEQKKKDAELSEVDRLKKDVSAREQELETLRRDNKSLRLSQELDSEARSLKLDFTSETARKDALKLLDEEDLGEDFESLGDKLKTLVKDRPYLFKKADPNQFIEDGSRKTRVSPSTKTQASVNKQRQRITPL